MSHLRPYPWDPWWYTTTRSPDGDLLLSPWWIAAIVAGAVIVLVLICVFCMFLCRPGSGWGAPGWGWGRAGGGGGSRPANACFDSGNWLACCVMFQWPRADQPYRGRRRHVYYSGSVDRPTCRDDDELSGYSSYRVYDDVPYYDDDEPHVIVSDQYYVEPAPSTLF